MSGDDPIGRCNTRRTDLCESAKQGKLCIDDLCHTGGETLCGFSLIEYQEMIDEVDECTCDIDGEDNCAVHYPIDDGEDCEDAWE